ncbi:YHS domain protein [Jannaschia sp. Os4]|uniref:YHS domain-containing (seleno)protein n=1 Tax=Jannaschia sp. Os4 TaxID=2807617 RepID=UPI00193AB3E5|nr:YHS domain-containing (seleno)protein [Jannaschia sp. Os4]MBM2576921.1 YHS domain protein [Jannaschia sp. Os4]
MPTRRTFLIGAAAIPIAAGGAYALLAPQPLAPARVYTEGGLAIRGTDPVAYFYDAMPVPGDPAVTHDWAGATWAFATVENRDRFAAEPARYAPAYGGFCAWAVAEKGELYSTQPKNWAIVDGRLFLNFDDAVQELWNAEPADFIAAADRRWPEIVAAV